MKRLLLALALCLSALPVLTGCGAEEVASDATAEDIARAAERTSGAGGASFVLKGTVSGPQGTLRLNGEGEEDKRGNATIDFDISDGKEDVQMRQVIAGTEIFMNSDLFEPDLPDGKEWIKIDARKAADELGIADVPQTGNTDPRDALRNLRAVGDVEKVGTEDVRGVATTHYRATVELRRLPEQVKPSERADARRSVDRLIKLTGDDTQETEVWIDEEDYVRRTQVEFSMKAPGGEQVKSDVALEYFDFGKRVVVEVPADSEAVDALDLAKREARKQSRSS
jgi:hypothetical protein